MLGIFTQWFISDMLPEANTQQVSCLHLKKWHSVETCVNPVSTAIIYNSVRPLQMCKENFM